MSLPGFLVWFFSVVVLTIALNVFSALWVPHLQDWLARLSAARANARRLALIAELAQVTRLSKQPAYLRYWLFDHLFFALRLLLVTLGQIALFVGALLLFRSWGFAFVVGSADMLLLAVGGALVGIGVSLLFGVLRLAQAGLILIAVQRGDRYTDEVNEKIRYFGERAQRGSSSRSS